MLDPRGLSNVDQGQLPQRHERARPSYTLHHYTRFDQVNQLVSASEADPDR